MMDEDEIKAHENRLRQSGWMDKATPEKLTTKKRRPVAPPPKRVGSIESRITTAARQMADEFNGYSWPLFMAVSEHFDLSYDDAVCAVIEAKRLTGDQHG